MADSRFVYVTYIRTTPERLWRAMRDGHAKCWWPRNCFGRLSKRNCAHSRA